MKNQRKWRIGWYGKKKVLKKEYVDLSDMPPLEGDEEVKEGKLLKILTPKKLLTRFPILLAKTKTRNNSLKLKSEISIIV